MRLNIELIVVFILFYLLNQIYLFFTHKKRELQVLAVQHSPLETNYNSYVNSIFLNILLIIALYYFIIKPEKGVREAFILGLVISGSMNFSNSILFNNWSSNTTIIDTVSNAIIMALSLLLGRKFMVKYL